MQLNIENATDLSVWEGQNHRQWFCTVMLQHIYKGKGLSHDWGPGGVPWSQDFCKTEQRGQTNEDYLKLHTYTYKWCQLMTIPSNTFGIGADNHTLYNVTCSRARVCTECSQRCTHAHTPPKHMHIRCDHTHISPILSSGVTQTTSSFGCPSP